MLQCEAITDIDVTAATCSSASTELNEQGVNMVFVEISAPSPTERQRAASARTRDHDHPHPPDEIHPAPSPPTLAAP